MAIAKTVYLPSGVVVAHHRIDALTVRFNGQGATPVTAIIEIGSYLDASAAATGRKPVTTQTLSVNLPGEPSRASLYTWLTAPIVYVPETVPTLTMVNGVPTPTMVTVQQAITQDTGFNGAVAA